MIFDLYDVLYNNIKPAAICNNRDPGVTGRIAGTKRLMPRRHTNTLFMIIFIFKITG